MSNEENEVPHEQPVDELLVLSIYRKLDPDLQEDARRFLNACLRQQRARLIPSNVVKLPLKRT